MNTQNVIREEEDIEIEHLVEGFLFHCKFEKNLTVKTLRAYQIDLYQFVSYIKKVFDNRLVANITKDVIKAYLQTIFHFKPKTIKRKIASLKAMFNYHEYENDHYVNPFRRIKINFKEPHLLPSVMSLDEVKKILRIMYNERNQYDKKDKYTYKALIRNIVIIEILFSTGMRVSEVCCLKFEDVNMKNGIIKIFGKGSKERIIQICQSETLSIIKTYYGMHKELIKSGSNFFVNRLGAPLSTQSVRLMVKSYVKKAGFTKNITPHVARHSDFYYCLNTSMLQTYFS